MARLKVKSNVFLLTLVGCTLIGTVASSEAETNSEGSGVTAIDELILRLKTESLTSKDLERMLNDHPAKDDKIYDNTVGQLAELCRETVDNCSVVKFKLMIELTITYETSIPQLVEYGQYCQNIMVKYYCVENIDKVVDNLSENIADEDKKRMVLFSKFLEKRLVLDRAHRSDIRIYEFGKIEKADTELQGVFEKSRSTYWSQEADKNQILREQMKIKQLKKEEQQTSINLGKDIRKAYSEYVEHCEPEMSPDLKALADSLEPYVDIYALVLMLNNGDEAVPTLKKDGSIHLFKFGRIAYRFRKHELSIIEGKPKKKTKSWF